MIMRLRVRLKSLCVAGSVCVCFLLYTLVNLHRADNDVRIPRASSSTSKVVARITVEDLVAIGHVTETQSDVVENSVTQQQQHQYYLPPVTQSIFNLTVQGGSPSCDTACQIQRTREEKLLETKKQIEKVKQAAMNRHGGSGGKMGVCDRTCRKKQLMHQGVIRHRGYAARVQVENMTLPESWTVTRELTDRLALRVQHVKETCRKYGLDKQTPTNQPNAWEFLINKQHGLAWCNIFKAASSTWIYNFNLLAGYTEAELMQAKETPINLARKRYPRPTVQELQDAFNSTHPPLTFMIARHPLKRLVSAYRDKILSGNRYYSRVSRTILKNYPEFGPGVPTSSFSNMAAGKTNGQRLVIPRVNSRATVPSFPQFVQYLVDEHRKGAKLDEHWTPMNTFCTPCLVPFDVFAKVETLEEDGNYIIFTAGIDDIIKPKRINRSRDRPTEEVADKFLCQLSKQQMEQVKQLYKYDLELFQYDVDISCT